MEWFNLYAFSYVAIYGNSFIEAAKATFALLKERGITAIINDNLIGGVLLFAAFMSALLGSMCTGLLAKYAFHAGDEWGWWCAIGGMLSFVMCVCAVEIVERFVCSFNRFLFCFYLDLFIIEL